jgi:short-subunit dehydrogenase
MTTLDGATVLVTGACGGFGREMMRQFLAAGSRLIVTDRDATALAEAVRGIRSEAGGRGEVRAVLEADLSCREGCERLCADATAVAVPDILVNNAGIGMSGRIDQIPWQQWETLMQVNLLSVMRLTGLFLPAMLERGSGHVVNISSIAGWVAAGGMSVYSASKFGVRGFGDSLARDLEDTGLRVTTVFPFFSRTPILDSIQFGEDPPRRVPDDIVTDPTDVVREILKGIREEREYVFPDPTARRLHRLQRFFPRLVLWFGRRFEARTRAAGGPG